MLRLALVTLILLAVGVGGLAFADLKASDRLAAGTQVAGVDVGGLTREQALDRVRRQVGDRLARPAQVRVGERSFTLSAAQAGVKADLRTAVQRAYDAGRAGNLATRGWRELTGGSLGYDADAAIAADRQAVRRFVSDIHRRLARKAGTPASPCPSRQVSVTPERTGRGSPAARSWSPPARAMSSPTAERVLDARLVDIPAASRPEHLRRHPGRRHRLAR